MLINSRKYRDFCRDMKLMMALEDDVMPSAPVGTAEDTPTTPEADFESPDVPDDLYASIPEGAEPMKRGTYHFRLHAFKKQVKKENGQPNFNLEWSCQEEPYTGRRAWDTVPAVLAQDVKDAADNNSPRCQEARKILKDRLWKQKVIMKAAGYKAPGMNFETFLNTNPELKIALDVVAQNKDSGRVDSNGKKIYVPDGNKQQNKIKEYLPL